MGHTTLQIFSWTFVILMIFWGLYTLRVINREKTHFKYHSKAFSLPHYRLFVPLWWTATKMSDDEPYIRFERTDTRYDWYAFFTWKKGKESETLESIANAWLLKEEIQIDEDRKLTTNKEHLLFPEEIKPHIDAVYRIEGTATEKESERIYYDLCLIKDRRYPEFFFAENKSSVLNGLVEGPYFEETLKHLESLN